jgi:serine/threonine protein kinase
MAERLTERAEHFVLEKGYRTAHPLTCSSALTGEVSRTPERRVPSATATRARSGSAAGHLRRIELVGTGRCANVGLTTGFDPRESDTTFGGRLVGTAGYVSPEQCGGKQPTTESDWYGVGVVLYQALLGKLPFNGPAAKVLTDKRRPERRPSGEDILRMLGKVGALSSSTSHPIATRLDPGSLIGRNRHLTTLHGQRSDLHTPAAGLITNEP